MGNLVTPKKPIYMGNSGTGTRLLMGLVAGSNALVTFYGDSSLTERPMDRIILPLEEMGARICAMTIRSFLLQLWEQEQKD